MVHSLRIAAAPSVSAPTRRPTRPREPAVSGFLGTFCRRRWTVILSFQAYRLTSSFPACVRRHGLYTAVSVGRGHWVWIRLSCTRPSCQERRLDVRHREFSYLNPGADSQDKLNIPLRDVSRKSSPRTPPCLTRKKLMRPRLPLRVAASVQLSCLRRKPSLSRPACPDINRASASYSRSHPHLRLCTSCHPSISTANDLCVRRPITNRRPSQPMHRRT